MRTGRAGNPTARLPSVSRPCPSFYGPRRDIGTGCATPWTRGIARPVMVEPDLCEMLRRRGVGQALGEAYRWEHERDTETDCGEGRSKMQYPT